MSKRVYKLRDVQEYLKEYYELDWRGFKVRKSLIEDGEERRVRTWDFHGDNLTCLSVAAIVYTKENEKRVVHLRISNDDLTVNFDRASVNWNDFLFSKIMQSDNNIHGGR